MELDPEQDHYVARIMLPRGPAYFGVLQGAAYSPNAKRPKLPGEILWFAMVDPATA